MFDATSLSGFRAHTLASSLTAREAHLEAMGQELTLRLATGGVGLPETEALEAAFGQLAAQCETLRAALYSA